MLILSKVNHYLLVSFYPRSYAAVYKLLQMFESLSLTQVLHLGVIVQDLDLGRSETAISTCAW